METIRELAEFRSSRFASGALPEECQVNPGRYGAELAFWLCTQLFVEHRIATSYPDYDDWDWSLSYSTEAGEEFSLHCENIPGTNNRWRISLRRYGRKLFGRDKPSFRCAADPVGALRRLLETEGSVTGARVAIQRRGYRERPRVRVPRPRETAVSPGSLLLAYASGPGVDAV